MRISNYRLAALIASLALAACGGGAGSSSSAISSAIPSLARSHATTVVVTVKDGAKALSGVAVELYTGKHVESCPPLGWPCTKKVKGLANGTTRKNGTVALTATFSSSEYVCAEAKIPNKTSQDCARPFPTRVLLQFR